MGYAKTIKLDAEYDDVVQRVRDAFQAQGFGILTEIDVQATLEKKIGEHIERYLILGACNPVLAHRALGVTRDIGLLLPCNVVVRDADDGGVIVQAFDPGVMKTLAEQEEICTVADEAAARIDAALAALTS